MQFFTLAATDHQWISGVQWVLSNATKVSVLSIRADNRLKACNWLEEEEAAGEFLRPTLEATTFILQWKRKSSPSNLGDVLEWAEDIKFEFANVENFSAATEYGPKGCRANQAYEGLSNLCLKIAFTSREFLLRRNNWTQNQINWIPSCDWRRQASFFVLHTYFL